MFIRQATHAAPRHLASRAMPAGLDVSGRRPGWRALDSCERGSERNSERDDNGIWTSHAGGVEIARWIR